MYKYYRMKIVSWDVGIKNLAYCIMEYQSDNKDVPFKVHEWGIINILNNVTPKCSFDIEVYEDKTKNKHCTKDASFGAEINGQQYYFCKAHKIRHNILLPTQIMTQFKSIKDEKDKPKCLTCTKNAQWNYSENGQEFYICTTHKNAKTKNETKGAELKNVKKMNCTNISVDDLKLTLFTTLDKMPQFHQVEEVIIENQPTLKNPKMKSVSNAVWDYFAIRGIIDREKTNSKINNVQFICPSNKLKVDNDNSIKVLSNTKNSTDKYKITKALGIIYCKQLLKNDKKFLDLLESHTKKDDLADCFLQGCWYLAIKKTN